MSRSQQQAVIDTAIPQNKAYNNEAQTSYGQTQQDIADYAKDVGAFKAANPYVQGGQFQTAANQGIADSAAAGAQALGQTLQGQSVRTGQNAGGAIAATEDMQARNQRAAAGEQAGATQSRLAGQTGYGEATLGAEAKIPGMEDTVANQEGQLAADALRTQAQASTTPGWGDVFGDAFGAQLGKTLAGGNIPTSGGAGG